MKVLHSECLGNGKLTELEVVEDSNGLVRILVSAGGNHAEVFRGSLEEARKEYKILKGI